MRRSATAHNPGVSLFPFLAVLICTMGVMMLLLVICNRPGVEGDDKAAGAAVAESDADAAKGVLSWRVAQLKSARNKTETDLADRRLRLSAVEEHMGQLREEWNALRLAAKDLELAELAKGEAEHLTEAQLAQLRQQLEQAKGDLGKAVERRRTEAPSFAIVPYEGPNGTRRRPIYIECSRDRVTIQPEGVVLTIEDFEGPSGPGNPLATILRAMRDYLAAQGAAGGAVGEPYPLLLVRPDGIQLFYGARAAMESWASEFGYELIEQDRKLAYPAPNPRLAQVEQVALADARARYAWFAQTRTARKRAEGERPVYRASTTGGGIVRVDHGSHDSGEGSGFGEQGSDVGGQDSGQTSRPASGYPRQWVAGGSAAGGQGSGVGGQGSNVGGQGSWAGGQGTSAGAQSSGTGGQGPGVGSQGSWVGGQGSELTSRAALAAGGQGSGIGGQGSGVSGQGVGVSGQGVGFGGQGSGVGGQGVGFGGPAAGGGNPALTGIPSSPFAPWGTPGVGAGGNSAGLGSPFATSPAGGTSSGSVGMPSAPGGVPTGGPGGNIATGGSGVGNEYAVAPPGSIAGNVGGPPGAPGSGSYVGGGAPYSQGNSAIASNSGNMYPGNGGPSGDKSMTGAPDGGAFAEGSNEGGPSVGAGSSQGNGGSEGATGGMPSGFNVAVNKPPADSHSVYDDRPPMTYARPQQPGPGEFVDSVHYTPPKPKPDDGDPAKKSRSLADERGRNWSLPSSAKQSVPVSRPIHIECRGDRLIILPDDGNAQPQVVMFSGRTEDSVDKLVAGVWSHTKGWGMAGRQMYWRPSLVLELGPSGEGRFTELQALMANSGLEVVRK